MKISVKDLPPHMRSVIDRGVEADMSVRLALPPEEVKMHAEQVMGTIDALSPGMRALVHEYGWLTVRGFSQKIQSSHAPSVEQAILANRRKRDEKYMFEDLDLDL